MIVVHAVQQSINSLLFFFIEALNPRGTGISYGQKLKHWSALFPWTGRLFTGSWTVRRSSGLSSPSSESSSSSKVTEHAQY